MLMKTYYGLQGSRKLGSYRANRKRQGGATLSTATGRARVSEHSSVPERAELPSFIKFSTDLFAHYSIWLLLGQLTKVRLQRPSSGHWGIQLGWSFPRRKGGVAAKSCCYSAPHRHVISRRIPYAPCHDSRSKSVLGYCAV
jgi:hypothetical protein